METLETVTEKREDDEIGVEADVQEIEQDETEDEELKFDPEKDLWVSVRVERRSGRESVNVSESSYWVWEVGEQADDNRSTGSESQLLLVCRELVGLPRILC